MNSERKKEYNFDEDLKNERFEKIFAERFFDKYEISKGYFTYWDILANGKAYEVKRDYIYNTTGNLLVEEYYNLEAKTKGWIYHTAANYLVVFYTDNDFYIVSMPLVKHFFFNPHYIVWECKDILQPEGFHTRNWVTPLKEELFQPTWNQLIEKKNDTKTKVGDADILEYWMGDKYPL